MLINLHDETWEFIAKTITDLGKAILTVGFASYFFERLPVLLRIGLIILGFLLMIGGIFIPEKSQKGEK
jgi:hypothetical protein